MSESAGSALMAMLILALMVFGLYNVDRRLSKLESELATLREQVSAPAEVEP